MKYIEENFIFEKGNKIYDYEIRILNNFISKLKSNQSVECICLVPIYIDKNIDSESDNICSIKLYILAKKELNDFSKIQKTINSFAKMMFNNKDQIYNWFSVEIDNATYFLSSKNIDKSNYSKDLVSSYILYDKNGSFSSLQDKYKDKVKPWNKVVALENIDKIDKSINYNVCVIFENEEEEKIFSKISRDINYGKTLQKIRR